jgi:hypothetical protein
MNQKLIGKISTASSTSTVYRITAPLSRLTTTLSSRSTTSLTSQTQSRRWLWILIALSFFLLLGFIGYFGFKQILLTFYRSSLNNNQFHSSSRKDSYATIKSNKTAPHPETKQIDTPITPSNQYDNSPVSPTRIKIRSQHLRLGPLDEDD